ncbi:hypothetical protein [Vibrio nitrifigilis]|nr:hypothetical protein [Vibrio nitrifigilis]MBF9001639.1 hypothetical protein [Vibrio nitrifigilis]
MLQLLMWGIVAFDWPLVASAGLLALLISYSRSVSLLHPHLSGDIEIDFECSRIYSIQECSYQSVNTLLAQWFIGFKTEQKHWVLLWRDSCSDEVYRHLLVALKRER